MCHIGSHTRHCVLLLILLCDAHPVLRVFIFRAMSKREEHGEAEGASYSEPVLLLELNDKT